jgi:hypothetical protein
MGADAFLLDTIWWTAWNIFVSGMRACSNTVPTLAVNCLRHSPHFLRPWRTPCEASLGREEQRKSSGIGDAGVNQTRPRVVDRDRQAGEPHSRPATEPRR